MKTVKDHISTEAVIGIVGVVVAIMGIVASLAWSRVRRRSRGRSRPSLSLSTTEGILSCYHTLDTSRKLTRNSTRRSTIIESPFARLPLCLFKTDSSLAAPSGRRRSITAAPTVLLCTVRTDNGTWVGSIRASVVGFGRGFNGFRSVPSVALIPCTSPSQLAHIITI